jgi:glycosyltransferase involved in cell wall biosynthesis
MRPRVTALIDTYNHERYIEHALRTVLDQGLSSQELEIIVVDDGSNDKTASIVETFAPRVKLIRKKNGGQASAFNSGFEASNGEIIAILDGDDWWAKGKLQTVLKAMDENPSIAAVSHGHFEVDEETQETRERKPTRTGLIKFNEMQDVNDVFSAWRFLLIGSLTVRRSLMEWLFPLPEEMVFMADTPLQVAAIFSGVLILDQTLFYYRQHSQNLFALQSPDKLKLKRKSEMAKVVYGLMPNIFLKRGVSAENVWNLLLPQEEYWFRFDPPGRLRYLWFLLRVNYWKSSQQTWRFTALNYLLAFGALFFGYQKHASMYEWRKQKQEEVERLYQRLFGARTTA